MRIAAIPGAQRGAQSPKTPLTPPFSLPQSSGAAPKSAFFRGSEILFLPPRFFGTPKTQRKEKIIIIIKEVKIRAREERKEKGGGGEGEGR